MKNIKHVAKTAAFALGTVVFPRVKPREEPIDIDAKIARIQASFRVAFKEELQ